MGVAESGDDFTKFLRIYQWFQTLIHPGLMQRPQMLSESNQRTICSNSSRACDQNIP
ncbi:hypothetical protein RintRC_4645 [Richelia intracellularis]|nr:hypothetical protein RintRC_4645 [Richelia intracellularis]